jgi:hypothetical protein
VSSITPREGVLADVAFSGATPKDSTEPPMTIGITDVTLTKSDRLLSHIQAGSLVMGMGELVKEENGCIRLIPTDEIVPVHQTPLAPTSMLSASMPASITLVGRVVKMDKEAWTVETRTRLAKAQLHRILLPPNSPLLPRGIRVASTVGLEGRIALADGAVCIIPRWIAKQTPSLSFRHRP